LRGLSQEEMAKKVNVSTRTIWSYENDINNLRNASYNTISLIANALEIRTGQIFLGDNFGKTDFIIKNSKFPVRHNEIV
jgi:DNA-binding helix-turn-helix protein